MMFREMLRHAASGSGVEVVGLGQQVAEITWTVTQNATKCMSLARCWTCTVELPANMEGMPDWVYCNPKSWKTWVA
jgi:hypothetical protein